MRLVLMRICDWITFKKKNLKMKYKYCIMRMEVRFCAMIYG